jgi:glycosyltransferase involved in cell wall biosynthesis
MPTEARPRLLFAGPILGRHAGWVPAPAEELAPRLTERGYSCSLTSTALNRYARMADILLSIARQRKRFDILFLQVYSGPSFVVEDCASWLAQRLGKPVVMVLHGGGMPAFMARFPGWTKRVLHRAQRVITPSAYLSHALQAHGYKAQIIPNGIDLSRYPYRHRPQAAPRLLWMRTFHEIYNPQMAVETLAQVRQEIPACTLTMAGQEKGALAATQALAGQLGLSRQVQFVGFLDTAAKQQQFAQHDIFLNTNRVDNMPVSVIEAAAFGLPVVATSVGGLPYMLRSGENGLLVPNEDSAAMSQAVLQLLGDVALAARLSAQGRQWAEGFDWSQVLPQWEQLFREMG